MWCSRGLRQPLGTRVYKVFTITNQNFTLKYADKTQSARTLCTTRPHNTAENGQESSLNSTKAFLDLYTKRPFFVADRLLHSRNNEIAVYYEDEKGSDQISYAALWADSLALAKHLRLSGVQPEDRIAVLLPKIPELITAALAAWHVGAVYVPLFTAFQTHAISHRCDKSGAILMITNAENLHKVSTTCADSLTKGIVCVNYSATRNDAREGVQSFEDIVSGRSNTEKLPDISPHAVNADSLLCMMMTSGTTGQPKGVPVPVKALASFHSYMINGLDLRPTDIHWNVSNPGWAYGLYYHIIGSLLCEQPIILSNKPVTTKNIIHVLRTYKVTNFTAAPTVYRILKAEWCDSWSEGVNLRAASSAGEPLNPELIEFFMRTWGVVIADHYGQTEVGMTVAQRATGSEQYVQSPVGSMGKVLNGWKIELLERSAHENGYSVVREAHHPAEIAIDIDRSGFYHFPGYYNEPEKTSEKIVEANDGRTYYLTGDMCFTDAEGELYFKGRNDDVILSAGYRIGPFEVENELMKHPSVAEVAVIGVPDAKRGEKVKAFVVLNPSYASDSDENKRILVEDLKDFVKTRLSAHEYPREILLLPELPKTTSGKVQRFELRKLQ
eukprot:CFRG8382T1